MTGSETMKHVKSPTAAADIGLLNSRLPAHQASSNPPVKAEILVKSDQAWNGTPYTAYPTTRPQLTVMRMTIAAHCALPWHTHAAPNAGYVLSGHLTLEDRASGQKKTFSAGDAFTEQVGPEHRGYTDDEACTVILTYAGTPDLPTSVPAPGEKPAY
jgi:quercetin dioxygenase-like cupin family protein